MRLSRMVNRLEAGDLEGIGRAIGHELPRNDFKLLAEVQSLLFAASYKSTRSYNEGYIDALRDIIAAYAAAVRPPPELNEDNDILLP